MIAQRPQVGWRGRFRRARPPGIRPVGGRHVTFSFEWARGLSVGVPRVRPIGGDAKDRDLRGDPVELLQRGSPVHRDVGAGSRDRKSTRLNSSHVRISYAVFCLKKKTQNHTKLSHTKK